MAYMFLNKNFGGILKIAQIASDEKGKGDVVKTNQNTSTSIPKWQLKWTINIKIFLSQNIEIF